MNNWRHPELQRGEIFLGNLTLKCFEKIKDQWEVIRMGSQAHIDGKPINNGLFPVFVLRSEIQEKLKS